MTSVVWTSGYWVEKNHASNSCLHWNSFFHTLSLVTLSQQPCFYTSLFSIFDTLSGIMPLSKFSGDNLAEDILKPETWRMTFRFIPIMELFRLREVCETFKEEINFLFGIQEKLGIFEPKRYPLDIELCQDPLHDVPNCSWIRLKKLKQHLPTLKSLFPSLKVLVINGSVNIIPFGSVKIEEVLDSFVDLECLTINYQIECNDSSRSFPKLKHLSLHTLTGSQLCSLPSLESLQMQEPLSPIKPWLRINVGRPSKLFEMSWFTFADDPVETLECLSSLPSSLECLYISDFIGYSRRFEPMFPKLKEVDRLRQYGRLKESNDLGNAGFVDFLKDHRLSLKKMSTHLELIEDEQLEDMLTCLEFGTYVTLQLDHGISHTDCARQFRLIGRITRERNFNMNIHWRHWIETLDDLLRLMDIIPPEIQSLTTIDCNSISGNEDSCRRWIERIIASPLRSVIVVDVIAKEDNKRSWTTAIQGLPETYEAILEWFEGKTQRVIIRRRN